MRVVQLFFSWRSLSGWPQRLPVLAAAAFAAVPARAVTLDSAMYDARDIAMTTSEGVAAFAERIVAGDMVAIQGAAFGFSALIAFIGLWLLVLREPRNEGVIIATDESEESLILHAVGHAPAQPAPSPIARPETERPARLLEAVAAARAQYEIAVAERQGRTLV
ncbi:MAG: hypothetical protein J7494_14745 [Sphingobium sp.]|nr:hypothetical protein [Sphingobium sp.]